MRATGARRQANRRASGQRNGPGRPMIAGSLNRLTRNGRTASNESGPPRFINTTATRAISGRSDRFGEQTRECLDILRWRLRQHTVSEIEYKGTAPERPAKFSHRGFERGAADDQQDRVEIALNRRERLQPFARKADRNHRIETDPVDPSLFDVALVE